ncbi:MAG: ABC transporter ATP-binding protein/permease [Lachnospiraceae bacterium]|nr:ABC transporter ATP-binding protein/permease [Lachnospiraceae bacterium]
MRYIIGYLKNFKTESILAPLFKMLEAVFELLVPLVVASIIDRGIVAKDIAYINRQFGVLIFLAVVGVITALTAQYFAAKAAICAASSMRRDLYAHVADFSEASMNRFGSSALITRLTNDIDRVQNGINMFLRLFLRSPFIVGGAFVMALTIDVKASMIILGVIGGLALIVGIVMKSTLPGFQKIQKALEGLLLRVSENLEGVRVLRAFRQEKEERKGFFEETDGIVRMQTRVGAVSATLNPLTALIVNSGIIILLYYSSLRVNVGSLSTGEAVALVNYLSQILVELLKLANLILLLTRAFSSVQRLEEIASFTPDEREHVDFDGTSDNGEAVRFSRVSFSYPEDTEHALSDMDLILNKGESLGIIGGTGSGKSTLVRLIRHAFDATEGQVNLFGKDIRAYADEEVSRLVGVVPQKAELFKGTVRSNLLMAKKDATEQEMWQALRLAQIADAIEKKEGVLDAPVERGGVNFSGGQRQRLTIARALIKRPAVLIFDDSASALDLVTERRLKEAVYALPWHPAVIFISQRTSSVMDAHRILVLENGKKEGYGTHEQLLNDCEVYREIYECQFGDLSKRKGGMA